MSVPCGDPPGIEIANRLVRAGADQSPIVGRELQGTNRSGMIRESDQLGAAHQVHYPDRWISFIVRGNRKTSAVGTDPDGLNGRRKSKTGDGLIARRIRPN